MRARLLVGCLAVVVTALGACGDDTGPAAARPPSTADDGVRSIVAVGGEDAALAMPVPQAVSSPREEAVPSALADPADPRLPEPLVDVAQIIPGGPPPDGIPPITDPRFLAPDEVTFLDDREPVLSLRIGDDARAYPMQVMIWHEVVNDTVDGVPVAVTYCPLCNTAIAYDRRLGERILEFGTSGRLYQSALVMYDRQTESLWSHFTGQALAGALTGTELPLYPVATVSWGEWRRANPGGLVLSRATGHERSYGQNPYPGYDDVDNPPFLFEGEADGRLAIKTRVVGLRGGGDALAVDLETLLDREVVDVDVGGRRVVVWARPGTASALDTSAVVDGRDVGSTGAFVPVVDGRQLSFVATDDGFEDRETGTRWNVLGEAVEGPLAGSALEPVEHVDTFWFAWAAFLPETRILG